MRNQIIELLKRPFMRLRSDYAFKRVYCSPEHAGILKKFLNALFEGKMVITDVTFRDKEVLPPDPDGKRVVYDAYCTTSTGYHFIVEMQRRQSEAFGKRIVFYLAACIYRQGEIGKDYNVAPVYVIVITDFDMKPFEQKLVNEIMLMEKDSHIGFTDDYKIYFLSLSQVSKKWHNCKTELERQLFLIKNMEKLDKNSEPYKSGSYDDIFKASELASMAKEDLVDYKRSILREMEVQSEIEFAKREAKQEGEIEGERRGELKGEIRGEKRGIEIGDAARLRKSVETMRSKGLDDAAIADFLGEDISVIRLI